MTGQTTFTSETGRRAALARHAARTPEQRSEDIRPAQAARATIERVDAKVDLLGATLLDRLDALQAQIAKLENERVAA